MVVLVFDLDLFGDTQDFVDRRDPGEHLVPPIFAQGLHPVGESLLLDGAGRGMGDDERADFIGDGQDLEDAGPSFVARSAAVVAPDGLR